VLREPGSFYSFQPGKIYNLNSDEIIQDHNDICKEEVAHVLLSAIAIT
jgi:hypothetical protein